MKTWNDITVAQWQHIARVIETEDNELLRWLEILPVLEPITKDQLRQLSLKDFGALTARWKHVFSDIPKTVVVKRWQFGDRVFICDPDIKAMKAGQFIDGAEIQGKHDAIDSYHQFLAIWWHEEGKGYDPVNFDTRAEFIKKHMPMGVAYPISNHFFQLWLASLPAIHDYLKREAAKATGSPSNGIGMHH